MCKSGELLRECSGLKWVLHFPVFIEKQSTCFKVAQLEKREPQLGNSSGVAKGDFRENLRLLGYSLKSVKTSWRVCDRLKKIKNHHHNSFYCLLGVNSFTTLHYSSLLCNSVNHKLPKLPVQRIHSLFSSDLAVPTFVT